MPDHTLTGCRSGPTACATGSSSVPTRRSTASTSGGPLLIRRSEAAYAFRGTARLRAHVLIYGINFEYSYNRPQWDTHRFSGEIRPIVGVRLCRRPDLQPNIRHRVQRAAQPRFCSRGASGLQLTSDSRGARAIQRFRSGQTVRYPGGQQTSGLFAVIDLGTSSNGIDLVSGMALPRRQTMS